mgnify:CR=1 FL=1
MKSIKLHRIRNYWHLIRYILRNLTEQSELNELIRWAKRKKLNGPRQAYQCKLVEVEEFLAKCKEKRRALIIFCELLFTAQQILVPKQKYYTKGSAAKYKFGYTSP